MNWYIAKVVFNITNQESAQSQFEEQLRLIEATSVEDAYLKAKTIGINSEEVFSNNNQITKRAFVDVADLMELSSLKNGTELYSRIHRTTESRSYIHLMHQRGMAIRLSAIQ